MRNDIFKTLFARMLATYLTVILCLLLLMGITVSSMFRNRYLQDQEDSLRREMANINAIIYEKFVHTGSQETAETELKMVARNYDALIQVVDTRGGYLSYRADESDAKWGAIAESSKKWEDENGAVILSLAGIDIWPSQENAVFRRTGGRQKAWSLQRMDQQPISEQGSLIYDLSASLTDMPTLTMVRAYMSDGRMDGVLLMHMDMSSINDAISKVYMDVLLIGLMAIAAAVLAVYYLTTRITKPITDMSAMVQRYSRGEFELRISNEGTDEVAQLAHSFNHMADAVSSLDQTRRSFVANVSHELRSPLTSISGFLEAIQDGTIPAERQGEYLDIVIAETKRMTSMVNNLLDLARIESGQTDMHPTVFDINELARRMVLTFEARITAKHLQVSLNLLEPNCFVEADVDQIGQVLRNLIDNAIKFSPEGGKLIIETDAADRRTARVKVQDFGAGIPEEDVRHVFDRFYKAEKAHTPSAQSGTGLGLSIVQVIMDQHGQDIFVESSPGEGATFLFTLRRAQEQRRRAESKAEQKPEERFPGNGAQKGDTP